MEEFSGWVKLYRNLHGSFSKVPKTDYNCWLVYVHLLEYCMWKDGDHLNQGQIIRTIAEIEAAIFHLNRDVIRACIKILIDKEFITQERVSKWNNAGHIYTVLAKKTSQQTPNSFPTVSQQPPNITDCNDEGNECLKITVSQHFPNTFPTLSQTIREEERRKKKEERIAAEEIPEIFPSAGKKRLAKANRDPTEANKIIAFWHDNILASYGSKPPVTAKTAGSAKAILKACKNDIDKAMEVVGAFCRDPNKFYQSKGHDLSLCLNDIVKFSLQVDKYRRPVANEEVFQEIENMMEDFQ